MSCTSGGKTTVRFDNGATVEVSVARTPQELTSGMSGPNPPRAMLFDFGRVGPHRMWMRDMGRPLDVAFLAYDGTVIEVAPGTPGSTERLGHFDSAWVLELPVAWCSLHGIKPGSKCGWPEPEACCASCGAGKPRWPHVGTGASPSAAQMAAAAQQGIATAATAPAQAQAAWAAATSDAANGQRIYDGASAAGNLIQNGYDPNSAADNQAIVSVIAGGLSLIPVYGVFLAGGLALLDAVAQGIGDVLSAIGLIPKPGCTSSGTFTPAQVLSDTLVPAGADLTPGTFRALAFAAIAQNKAAYENCKPAYPESWIVDGLVQLWNANVSGDPVPYYFPPTNDFGSYEGLAGSVFSSGPPLTGSGWDPYKPWAPAFRPMADLDPSWVSAYNGTPVMLNGGAWNPNAGRMRIGGGPHGNVGGVTALAPKPTMSTGTKVATVAAVGVGAVAAGTLFYAYFTGKTLGAVWAGAKAAAVGLAAGEASASGKWETQTVLVPRDGYTLSQAGALVRSKGYATKKVDVTENYYRFRQRPPSRFRKGSMRTVERGALKLVRGRLK